MCTACSDVDFNCLVKSEYKPNSAYQHRSSITVNDSPDSRKYVEGAWPWHDQDEQYLNCLGMSIQQETDLAHDRWYLLTPTLIVRQQRHHRFANIVKQAALQLPI